MRSPIEALQQAVDLAGGQTELARKINAIRDSKLTQGHVWAWLNRENRKVPAEFCLPISQIAGGEVRPEELRPDVFDIPAADQKQAS